MTDARRNDDDDDDGFHRGTNGAAKDDDDEPEETRDVDARERGHGQVHSGWKLEV